MEELCLEKFPQKYGKVRIKSNWFDRGNKKILKFGHEGLAMFFLLCKHRVGRATRYFEQNEYTFHVTLDLLAKASGCTKSEVVELLKLLVHSKVLKLCTPTRWDRLDDKKGGLLAHKMIILESTDSPKTFKDDNGKDMPLTNEDYFVWVDLDLMEYYKQISLGSKYFPLHCLIRKLSNATEKKAFMTIEHMAEALGNSKDTIYKYVKDLNNNYLLYSRETSNGKGGIKFEHFILRDLNTADEFLAANRASIERNIKKWKNRSEAKVKSLKKEAKMLIKAPTADLEDKLFSPVS